MMGSPPWETSYVPPELKENLAELFPGLTIEEALQHQESLYQSLTTSCDNQTAKSSENGQTSSQSNSRRESSLSGSGEFNMALDEALARSLQELDLEDEVHHPPISEPVHSTAREPMWSFTSILRPSHRSSRCAQTHGNIADVTEGTSVLGANQDSIDPDRMTYEELRSLGEAIGSESRGLSEHELSSLPCYKYKAGFFSKKVEIGECVICYTSYKNRQSVTSLPCLHQYHTECINCWLRQNRTCPICQKEVWFLN